MPVGPGSQCGDDTSVRNAWLGRACVAASHTEAVSSRGTPSTSSSTERLVFFTDAIAAIAVTLLVLPLVDTVFEAAQRSEPFGALIDEHLVQFGGFMLSFAVIYRFWWAHHELFEHITVVNRRIVGLNALWAFAIAFMPLPTAIITAYPPSVGTVALYGGTLSVASGTLTLIATTAQRNPQFSRGREAVSRDAVLGNATAFCAQLVATLIGCVFAGTVNYWAFLLMFLTDPVERLVRRSWSRR